MPKTIVEHIIWNNVEQTKEHAEKENIAQPENADGGSSIWDEAEEAAKEE